ncbi:LiPid Depleted [Trichostrongylus colubriformis]|uniref:LiPid Depleted n=1 Tax=Trichostrongylus colubriformis TaxID=6319 RepID=A0AAN8J3D2_TRICO
MPRRKRKGRSAKAARRGLLGVGGASVRRHRKSKKNDDVLDEQEKAVKQIRAAGAAKAAEDEKARQPHSFVIHRGAVGKYIKALENDIRQIMDPFTAKHLKTLKRNNIKDFVIHGAVLGVTNMIVLTTSDTSVQLRMMRFNQGPTLTFRVPEYSLSRHILSTQKRPLVHQKLFEKPPLVVMNGFNQSGKKHLLLVETFIQNMFPSINIDTLELRTVKRCLMVNYFEEDDTIELRHYAIRTVASGLNKSVRKLVQAGTSTTKSLPDLSKYKDIADYLLNPGHLSDSEYDGEQEEVVLSQSISEQTGTMKGEKSHIRLMEIGPRMKLELLKVQDGIDEGEVLYHKIIKKTSEELERLKKEAPIKKKLKKRREQEMEHRVIRRLENAKERAKREEEELKAFKEKAARKQAAATGQTEDIENSKEKDREIALNRERELKRGTGGGEGQNRPLESDRKRRRKEYRDKMQDTGKHFGKRRRD